jgi:hypothetical protein
MIEREKSTCQRSCTGLDGPLGSHVQSDAGVRLGHEGNIKRCRGEFPQMLSTVCRLESKMGG